MKALAPYTHLFLYKFQRSTVKPDIKNLLFILLILAGSGLSLRAQPPCTIEFSQCPKDTTILACPNSPGGFTLSAYPPVSAYLAGSCPTGASLVVQQTAGPTLPAVIPAGGYLIQYVAFLNVNGQPTGQTKLCSFQLFVVADNQPPVFTYCPPPITVNGTLDNNGNCTATGQWPLPIFTDNCGPNQFIPGGLQVNIPCGSTLGSGTHTITYTAYDGSGNSSTCSFTVTVLCPSGTDDPGKQPVALEVFPNPGSGLYQVELSSPAVDGMRFRLSDQTGRMQLEQPLAAGYTRQTLNASAVPGGLYFLQLIWEERVVQVGKVLKL